MTSDLTGRTIIHVGGVGTNSYLNAKLMNERGYVAHVAANDIYHCICAPEWQELGPESFSRDELGDDFFPNFFRVAASADARKRWFAQGPQLLVIAYLYHQVRGEIEKADHLWDTLQFHRFKAVLRRTSAPEAVRLDDAAFKAALKELKVAKVFVDPLKRAFEAEKLINRFIALVARLNKVEDHSLFHPPFAPEFISAICAYDDGIAAEIAAARALGVTTLINLERMQYPLPISSAPMQPVDQAGFVARMKRWFGVAAAPALPPAPHSRIERAGVLPEDAAVYAGVLPDWNALFGAYDLRMFYGGSGVLGLLSDTPEYMAYEHGTIRSLPFEDSTQGRLVRAAFEQADAVFITNTDYVTAERRLEFAPEKRVYIPHVFDERPLTTFARENRVEKRPSDPAQFFMPSRQDWLLNDPMRSKANHLVIDAAALLVDNGDADFHVTFIAWGDDIEASKARIAEKGLDAHFSWSPTLMRRDLWMRYLQADAVMDQFLISGISGVTYEALALGCRVITKDDGVCNREFFGEAPPFLAASTPEEIAARMRQIMADVEDIAGLGATGQVWVANYHSGNRFVALEEAQFRRIAAKKRA